MSKHYLCLSCQTIGKPQKLTKGSIIIEFILWCCFLIPGFIYSVWRMTTKDLGCKLCKSTHIIPASSPQAIKMIKLREFDK